MPHDLSFSRTLAAPPAALWRCWTDPALLCRWFTPVPVQTVEAAIDPRPGGRFFTRMRMEDGAEVAGEGCVLVAEPDRRLVWTNALTDGFTPATLGTGPGDFPFTAEIRFDPDPGGCRYHARVWHRSAEDRQAHAEMGFEAGWGAATTQLEAQARSL